MPNLSSLKKLPLIISLCLSSLILLSWLHPYSRQYWDIIDEYIFFFANGSLEDNQHWQYFWAIANNRAFDLIPACLILSLYAHFCMNNKDHLSTHIANGFFMAIYCFLSLQIAHILMDFDRKSPTLILEPAYLLSELVPSIKAKDMSGRSFPGDHATILLMVSYFMLFYCGRKYALSGLFITLIFSTPRLVSGAHWLTDILVAAPIIAIFAVGIAIFTPIQRVSVGYISKQINKLLN
ncbi:phosphatase PAP2 family protein [Rickettsiales bacterium]|nr:phosphatase PAP2 family protein [Rickettsiales bacterium]